MKKYIVFDIDGTLADISHSVHHVTTIPKDFKSFYSKMGEDTPIEEMKNIMWALFTSSSFRFIFCTGREGTSHNRETTRRWLEANFEGMLHYPIKILMRKEKDYREDSIVKLELLRSENITPEETLVIYDDRASVVKIFRRAGYYVHHVAEGNF